MQTSPTHTEATQTRSRQDAFLQAYAEIGTIRGAQRTMAGIISRTIVYRWLKDDPSFRTRFEHAQHDYRELLEDMVKDRLTDPAGNRGSDLLLIFSLKARWPERYRENVMVSVDDAPKVIEGKLVELFQSKELSAPAAGAG